MSERAGDGDKRRGKVGQTKVKRYWPGKAPDWAGADDDGDISMADANSSENAFPVPIHDDSVIVKVDDPRLRRLAEINVDNRDEVRADHRRIRQSERIVSIEEENQRRGGLEAEEEDSETLELRRKKIKEKNLQREAAVIPNVEEDEEAVSEVEEELEEETPGAELMKPVFIPKSDRATIIERERLEANQQALEELEKRRTEERKKETRQIVVEEIRKDSEIQKNVESEANVSDVDTNDDINGAEEYKAWKVRKIAGFKRERDQEVREGGVRENPEPGKQQKPKLKFLQKDFHKGAFFQSQADDPAGTAGTDDIYTRDYSAPTGEDNMDKTILPKVMQVKNFGRRGRTKWTHLVIQDTTDWNNPWTYNDRLRAKYNAKMAGMDAPITKPRGSKKLKRDRDQDRDRESR